MRKNSVAPASLLRNLGMDTIGVQDQPLFAEPLMISSSRHPSKELQTRRLESVNGTQNLDGSVVRRND